MQLPNEFKFTTVMGTYTASKAGNSIWRIHRPLDNASYGLWPKADILRRISSDEWLMVPQVIEEEYI